MADAPPEGAQPHAPQNVEQPGLLDWLLNINTPRPRRLAVRIDGREWPLRLPERLPLADCLRLGSLLRTLADPAAPPARADGAAAALLAVIAPDLTEGAHQGRATARPPMMTHAPQDTARGAAAAKPLPRERDQAAPLPPTPPLRRSAGERGRGGEAASPAHPEPVEGERPGGIANGRVEACPEPSRRGRTVQALTPGNARRLAAFYAQHLARTAEALAAESAPLPFLRPAPPPAPAPV